MWREVQPFDFTRLILTEIEGNAASRQQWEHETHFFHPLEDALHEEEIPTVTKMLKLYHDSGRKIGLAHRDVLGALMPTQSLLDHMRKKYKLEDFTQKNINKLQNRLAPLHAMYDELFHRTDRFFVTYPESDLKLVLKVMEAIAGILYEDDPSMRNLMLYLQVAPKFSEDERYGIPEYFSSVFHLSCLPRNCCVVDAL